MENNNGVFSDLFQAVGAPIQNVADTVGNGVNSAISVAQSCTNACTNILTGTASAGLQLIQSVVSGITSAIAPKQ
jgi:chlorosome envelope protein F